MLFKLDHQLLGKNGKPAITQVGIEDDGKPILEKLTAGFVAMQATFEPPKDSGLDGAKCFKLWLKINNALEAKEMVVKLDHAEAALLVEASKKSFAPGIWGQIEMLANDEPAA